MPDRVKMAPRLDAKPEPVESEALQDRPKLRAVSRSVLN
jgi:hypothetical protein